MSHAEIHFVQRARERGITRTNPHLVFRLLIAAHQAGGTETAEHVIDVEGDRSIWRFRVDEGIFYAVMSASGMPITLLTHEMMKIAKAQRRGKVKGWRHAEDLRIKEDIYTHRCERRKRRDMER